MFDRSPIGGGIAADRLLFVCTEVHGPGGIQRFNRTLLDAWSELGQPVDVVALNDPRASVWKGGVNDVRLHGAERSKWRFAWRLAALLLRRRHRVVCGHVHLLPIIRLLGLVTGHHNRVTLIVHGIEVWGRIGPLYRVCSRTCQRVLAVSRYTLNSFLAQVPSYPASAAFVFPNALSRDLPPATRSDGNAFSSFRLLSVARLDASESEKGIRHVIDALTQLNEPEISYTVVGDGTDRDGLVSYASARGVRVRFPGYLSDADLREEYRHADVFVLPSKKEGFGIVFLEAGCFQLPVIAANEKGATDVIADGVNGLLVEYGNVRQLGDAIVRLRSNPAERERMGKAGRQAVEEDGKFGFRAFCTRTQKFLT